MKVMVAILMAGLLMPVAAVAQEWKLYTYPDPGFSIQFPGVPAVETGTVKNPTGVSLPWTRYVVRQDRIIYSVSIVNYSSTNDDALSTIFATQKSFGASGKVTAVSGARVNRNFGRELTIDGTDGSRSAVAIFFVNKHLYTVVGQSLPPNAVENSGDAIRFQQSLQFREDSGGFFGLFGGGGGSSSASSIVAAGSGGGSGSASGGGGTSASSGGGGDGGGTHSKGAYTPPADAACTGKSAGDRVQLQTPDGPVFATCTLVARPDTPAKGP